ncbi:MAG TPA: amidohydrolase family protein [Planctomycetota bacterium]|nr:amidohydrolase family protein [Planctomycetota bacterium]
MIDLHQHPGHMGKTVDDILSHMAGLGARMSVLLPTNRREAELTAPKDSCRKGAEKYPDRFVWFCAPHPGDADAAAKLTAEVEAGACGFGEHKVRLPCDDARSMALYRLAGELGVPVLIHFEDANFNTGFENFEPVLRTLPDTTFIGHAQTFWANISAADAGRSDYPKEHVTPGGLTDRWLADYPNLYADLSAGSGLNACERDVDFYRGFLARHRKKLLWATDCPCRDGHGGGWEKGICFGERMLAHLRQLTGSEDAFEDITKANLKRVLGMA